MKTLKESYEVYLDGEERLAEEYARNWKNIFASYGFTIIDTIKYRFSMKFNSKKFDVYFCPARYQGVKIEYQTPKMGVPYLTFEFEWTKCMSESGVIKFMKKYQVGNL